MNHPKRRRGIKWPERVDFYPVLGVEAARRGSRCGGGWRLYTLAKAIDRQGVGSVLRRDLLAYARHLGISHRQWERWVGEARAFGLMRDVQAREGAWRFILVNPGLAAMQIHSDHVGKRKAGLAARDLIGPGWKARVWAAYEATFNERPISRSTLQEVIHVAPRTQYHREKQAGVTAKANYAKSRQGSDALIGVREHGDRNGAFETHDHRLAWRLPDTRTTDIAERRAVGRARKANKILQRLMMQGGSFPVQRPLNSGSDRWPFVRLFHWTRAGRRAAERKLAGLDHQIREVYQRSKRCRSGARMWTPYATR